MKNLLVCNCLGDDKRSPISMYLMNNKLPEVVEGVNKLATEKEADVLYYLPEGSKVEGLEGEVRYGKESPVTCNPFAIAQMLKGNLPRPMDHEGYVAEHEGKVILVTSPEEAYKAATGAEVKFVYVQKAGATEVKEVAIGTNLSDVVDVTGAKGVLLGGIKGTFVAPSAVAEYTVTDEHLYDSVVVYTDADCMVDTVVKLMSETQEASCGKCVLCREGSLQFKTITAEMTQGKAKATDPAMLKEVGELIKIGAYCDFGKKMPQVLISAIDLFPEEFDEHIKRKSCKAGVCYKKAAVYVIMPDMCVGCEDCVDECPEDAIEGKKGFIHMIDQDMCENCGKCVSACDEGAIVAVEGKLPKLTFLSIEYFLKVAETLNFTVAARELYISQPALSKQIKQLEEEIGVRLFRRDTKQVELTAGGRILYEEWSKMVKNSENAILAAKTIEEKQVRKIRVGIAEFNGLIDIIAPILEKFSDMDNNIEVIYEVHGFSQLRRMLEKDEVDLIFSLNTELPIGRKKLCVQPLIDMQLCIILPQKHHLTDRETLDVEDLMDETILMFSEQYSEAARKSVEMHFAKKGLNIQKIQEFPNVRSLELALTNGNGVTLGYRAFFSDAQKFKYYPIADEIGIHQLVLAWDEDKEKKVQELLDFCLSKKIL